MRSAFTSVCLVLLWTPCILAHAQPSLPGRADEPADPSDRERAVELFRQSRAAFDAGDYAEAARLSRQAYQLSPDGDLLYNHARSLDLAKSWDDAIKAYQELVQRFPDHGKQRFALQRIEEIDALRARATEAPSPAPLRPVPTPDEPHAISPWPWVILGVGVAGVGAGLAVGGVSAARHDKAVDEPGAIEATELQAEADELQTVAIATLAVSGAVAAAGLIWGIVDATAEPGVAIDVRTLRIRF